MWWIMPDVNNNNKEHTADELVDAVLRVSEPLLAFIYRFTKITNSRLAKQLIEESIVPMLHTARKKAISDKTTTIIQP